MNGTISWILSLLSLSVICASGANPSFITYHEWSPALFLTNKSVQVIVVPSIGRVMQFRFAGEKDGPFWENAALYGKDPDAHSTEWGNFGGDKTWPAPQSDWPHMTPRSWPPPAAFDSMPVEAEVIKGKIVLTSPVDAYYGIQTRREISLEEKQPVLRIVTTFEKVRGEPIQTGVWIITQLKNPESVFAPIPKRTIFSAGYGRQSETLPLGLKFVDGLLSLKRDSNAPHKVGTDASSLIWVGKEWMMRIDSARNRQGEYPDNGSSAEVYTNPDPLTYVELEMLGPLETLHIGEKLTQTNRYELFRRTGSVEADLKRALKK